LAQGVFHIDRGRPLVRAHADYGAAYPDGGFRGGDFETTRILVHDLAGNGADHALGHMHGKGGLASRVRVFAHIHRGVGPKADRAVVVEQNFHPAPGIGLNGVGNPDAGMQGKGLCFAFPLHTRAGGERDNLADVLCRKGQDAHERKQNKGHGCAAQGAKQETHHNNSYRDVVVAAEKRTFNLHESFISCFRAGKKSSGFTTPPDAN